MKTSNIRVNKELKSLAESLYRHSVEVARKNRLPEPTMTGVIVEAVREALDARGLLKKGGR